MHLFKHFFKILSRNKTGLIIYGIISITMLVSLALSVKSGDGDFGISTNAKSYNISYEDNDKSLLSKGLIDYLSETNKMRDYTGRDDTEISNIVFFGMTEYHFIIPKGFMENVNEKKDGNGIEFETAQGNDGYASYDIDSRINTFINSYNKYRTVGFDEEEAIAKTKDMLRNESSVVVLKDENNLSEAGTKDNVIFQINQYLPYLILGMLSLGIGHTIIITNNKETVERILVSPVQRFMPRLINTLGLMVSGIVIWIIFTIINFTYGADTEIIKNYGWIVAVNSFLCMLTSCAITSLLTDFVKNSNTLSMVTNILALGMAFISGVFVPMRFLSAGVLSFAKFLPFYWTVYVNNMTSPSLSKYEFDMHQILISFAVEFLFTIAITTIAIISGKKCIIKE